MVGTIDWLYVALVTKLHAIENCQQQQCPKDRLRMVQKLSEMATSCDHTLLIKIEMSIY